MTPFAAGECGTEEQSVDHVVLHCPIHGPPVEHMTCRFLMTKQSNGCSTPAPRSNAV